MRRSYGYHQGPSRRLHTSELNREEITRAELRERQAERECPRCGRKIDPEEATQIKVGGTWGPSL